MGAENSVTAADLVSLSPELRDSARAYGSGTVSALGSIADHRGPVSTANDSCGPAQTVFLALKAEGRRFRPSLTVVMDSANAVLRVNHVSRAGLSEPHWRQPSQPNMIASWIRSGCHPARFVMRHSRKR